MADEPKLTATTRIKRGTAECRRLRRQGLTPGNVYGHDKPPVAISVPSEQLDSCLKSGQRMLDCEIDGKSETTMFREIQWDTYGVEIKHFDLIRIDPNERVTIEVPVELRGTSPGVLAGGLFSQPLHELTINCLAAQIPESILVRINELEIDQAIHVGDLEIPPNVICENPPEAVVVQVTPPLEEPEELEEEVPGPAEPEVIGQKKEAEEEESSS